MLVLDARAYHKGKNGEGNRSESMVHEALMGDRSLANLSGWMRTCCVGKEGKSQGLKPAWCVGFDARSEARAYHKGKNNDSHIGNDSCKDNDSCKGNDSHKDKN